MALSRDHLLEQSNHVSEHPRGHSDEDPSLVNEHAGETEGSAYDPRALKYSGEYQAPGPGPWVARKNDKLPDMT